MAGGGVRIGLEDNIWFDQNRTTLATNAMLLERISSIIKHLGFEPATPKEAREILGLKNR